MLGNLIYTFKYEKRNPETTDAMCSKFRFAPTLEISIGCK